MEPVRRLGFVALGLVLAAVCLACSRGRSFERLAGAIEPVARDVGVHQAASRETRGAQSAARPPEVYARVEGAVRGVPEEVAERIRTSLKRRGFTMVEGPSPSYPFVSRWRRDGVEVDAAVEGAPRFGEQSLEVRFEARSG